MKWDLFNDLMFIYLAPVSRDVEGTQLNQNVTLVDADSQHHVTVDVNRRTVIFCFLCSFRAATFFYNHAPEPLPAVHRCIHPASCVRVYQGRCSSALTSHQFLLRAGRVLNVYFIFGACNTHVQHVWGYFQCSVRSSDKSTKIIFLKVCYAKGSFVHDRGFLN